MRTGGKNGFFRQWPRHAGIKGDGRLKPNRKTAVCNLTKKLMQLSSETSLHLHVLHEAFASGPKLVNIQEFLQSQFINAVAKRIHEKAADLEKYVVVGYDMLNEPNVAFIGAPDLSKRPPHQELLLDLSPTILQSFLRTFPKEWDIDPEWVQQWRCIWANHSVWEGSEKDTRGHQLRQPGGGADVPRIRRPWMGDVRCRTTEASTASATPHFYDGLTLISKNCNTYLTGPLWRRPQKGADHREMPCVIGEIGIPMDLEGGKAFKTSTTTRTSPRTSTTSSTPAARAPDAAKASGLLNAAGFNVADETERLDYGDFTIRLYL
ncbi:hypothetical protein DFJ73DRAFT_801384 [Zopfochytrium polystomum]|nr:hypothetical protein DFJ73DRAFT_801384 [Zopfochytrium polystomum]